MVKKSEIWKINTRKNEKKEQKIVKTPKILKQS